MQGTNLDFGGVRPVLPHDEVSRHIAMQDDHVAVAVFAG